MRSGRWRLWLLLAVLAGFFGGGVAAFAARQARSPVPLVLAEVRQVASAEGATELAVVGSGFTGDLRALLSPLPGRTEFGTESALSIPLFSLDAAGEAPLAATGRNARLLLVDWREGAPAEVLGSVLPPESLWPSESREATSLSRLSVQSLARLGTNLVLSHKNNGGVLLYDVGDPQHPRFLDHIDATATVYEMLAHRGRIYATDGTAGLKLIDIVDRGLALRNVPGPAGSWKLAADGRSLVVASRSGELALYALERDGWPRLVGRFSVGAELRDLTFSAAGLHLCTAEGWLYTYDTSRWPSLRFTSKLQLPGRPLQIEAAPADPWLFVSLVGLGVIRIEVGQPLVPKLAGLLALGRMPTDFTVAGRRLLLVSQRGLETVPLEQWPAGRDNFTNRLLPGEVKFATWNGAVLAFTGTDLVFLSDAAVFNPNLTNAPCLVLPDLQGLRLYPLTKGVPEKSAVIRHTLPHSAEQARHLVLKWPQRHFWKDHHLFVLGPSHLWIMAWDLSGRLTPVGQYDFVEGTEAQAMALIEPDHVAVAAGRKGLIIVDVRNRANPRLAGGHPVPGHLQGVGNITDVLVDGSRLFACRSLLGVEIFDASDPRHLVPLQFIDTPGAASALVLHDGLLLVADGDKGGQVIDVHKPTAQRVANLSLPPGTKNLVLSEREIFTEGPLWRGLPPQPLPRRLAFTEEVTNATVHLALPVGTPPGQYTLTLYGGGRLASLPVTLK